jgi:DNA-binding MarR family transcriptional regulator
MADFNAGDIDEIIHGTARLGIMAYLSTAEAADFTTLKEKLALTDGNLSVHLKKLEEARYVRIDKRFVARKPRTQVTITAQGRRAFAAYLDSLAPLMRARIG